MRLRWSVNPGSNCLHLEEGDRKLLDAFGEVGLDDAAAQAVVPHQPPPTVLAQVEVLQTMHTCNSYSHYQTPCDHNPIESGTVHAMSDTYACLPLVHAPHSCISH